MAKLPGNSQLLDSSGRPLSSLSQINRLGEPEKNAIYARLLPERLLHLLSIDGQTLSNPAGERLVTIIAPAGLSLIRIEARSRPERKDTVFFLELSDTHYQQMELAFCIICDPFSPRFNVDLDEQGNFNWFASHGRNIPEELRAMQAGLFPNQTRRGLRLFADFFPLFERFVDSLGIEMITAEPLTYDNAIRYEKYGFEYLRGLRLMREIDREFQPEGRYFKRLDGSSMFRMSGMERTVRGRSWAIHDGIMDQAWDEVQIYKVIGVDAGITTFPGKLREVCE